MPGSYLTLNAGAYRLLPVFEKLFSWLALSYGAWVMTIVLKKVPGSWLDSGAWVMAAGWPVAASASWSPVPPTQGWHIPVAHTTSRLFFACAKIKYSPIPTTQSHYICSLPLPRDFFGTYVHTSVSRDSPASTVANFCAKYCVCIYKVWGVSFPRILLAKSNLTPPPPPRCRLPFPI
jgi:hypothetical protein